MDLFAGAGGLSLGFEQAGFDVLAAVEYDPVHAAAHKFNFPDCAVLPKSVIGLRASEIRTSSKIGNRQVDVVFGGAPCQGFSMIGQRAIDDPRNLLVKEFVRLVAELDSAYFVFENVKGLTVGRHRQFLDELLEEFGNAGYNVTLPWKVLNASNFGVPQSRERLFLFGSKRSLPMPAYPSATTEEAGRHRLSLPQGPTCEDALSDLPNPESFPELLECDQARIKISRIRSAYARELRCEESEHWHLGYRREWDPKLLTSSHRTVHTPISRRRFAKTEPGEVEPISRFFRLPSKGVSNTLRAGTDASRGAFTSPRPIHYEAARCITVREMARLHGFPDWFRFHESKWHGARQIGNSVPPPLARAVAQALATAMGISPPVPNRMVGMESDILLRMSMIEASRYFGVKVPISTRNRRSASRKRKQQDIEEDRL